jgi:hypothetical protein
MSEFLKLTPEQLQRSVEAQNEVNSMANKIQKEFKESLMPYIGTEILDGSFKLIPEILIPEGIVYFHDLKTAYPEDYKGIRMFIYRTPDVIEVVISKKEHGENGYGTREQCIIIANTDDKTLIELRPSIEYPNQSPTEIVKKARRILKIEKELYSLLNQIDYFDCHL